MNEIFIKHFVLEDWVHTNHTEWITKQIPIPGTGKYWGDSNGEVSVSNLQRPGTWIESVTQQGTVETAAECEPTLLLKETAIFSVPLNYFHRGTRPRAAHLPIFFFKWIWTPQNLYKISHFLKCWRWNKIVTTKQNVQQSLSTGRIGLWLSSL